MAITIAQHTGTDAMGGTTTNPTITYAGAQTGLNLNAGIIFWGDTTNSINSVSDTQGNAYSLFGNVQGTGITWSLWYCLSIAAHAAGNVLTYHASGALTGPESWIIEANNTTGAWSAGPFNSGAGASGTAMSTGTSVLARAPALGFAAFVCGSGAWSSAGAGWTALDINSAADASEWQAFAASGNATATGNQNSSASWECFVGYFYALGDLGVLLDSSDPTPRPRRSLISVPEDIGPLRALSAAGLLKTGWDQDLPPPRYRPPRLFEEVPALNKTKPLPTLFDSLDPLAPRRPPPVIFGETAGLSKTKPLATPFEALDVLPPRRPPRPLEEWAGFSATKPLLRFLFIDELRNPPSRPRPLEEMTGFNAAVTTALLKLLYVDEVRAPVSRPRPLEEWSGFDPTKPLKTIFFADEVRPWPPKPKPLEEVTGFTPSRPLATLFFVDEVSPWPSKPKPLEEWSGFSVTKPLLRLFANDDLVAPVRRPPRIEEQVITPRQVASLATWLADPGDTRPRLMRGANFDDVRVQALVAAALRTFLPPSDDVAPTRARPRLLEDAWALRGQASPYALFEDVLARTPTRPRPLEEALMLATRAAALLWPDDPRRSFAPARPLDLDGVPLLPKAVALTSIVWATEDMRRPTRRIPPEMDPGLLRTLPPIILSNLGWYTDELRGLRPWAPRLVLLDDQWNWTAFFLGADCLEVTLSESLTLDITLSESLSLDIVASCC